MSDDKPEEIDGKEKMTTGEIVRVISYVIMSIAILVGSFVIRGNRDRIVSLEGRS